MSEINHEAVAIAKALAIPITPVPAPGTHPDAELMAACAAFDAAEREHLGLFYGPNAIEDEDERDRALDPIEEERDRLARVVCSLRATTLDGHLARIRCVMLEDMDLDPAEDARSSFLSESLVGALIRDLAEHAGARRPA